jgi:hypothetical protein
MTDSTMPPPPAPLPVPPSPVAPVGRPRIWQAALLFVAFGSLAAFSCAQVLSGTVGRSTGSQDLWSLWFVASVPLASGALALMVFRLWRRRKAEHWPSLFQCVMIGLAGGVLAVGGCGAWAVTMDQPGLLPVSIPFGALFVIGLALGIGAVELFAIGVVRLILKRPGAR